MYALGDGTTPCSQKHDFSCQRCDEISYIFDTIESAFSDSDVSYRYEKQREELLFDFEAAKEKIIQLKAHLLRAKNQERAKTKILDELLPNQCLMTMDWAMKFLPMKFREAQQDWFAKKGISWHVSALVTKTMENEYQIHCFVHVLVQCKQDWFSVYSLIEACIAKLQVELPQVTELFLRSDNVGCYHNASLLLSLPSLSKAKGIFIKRYDFSEAQSGKDICDRKIAPMKAHMQRYVNEGHDVQTALDMKNALETYGGVRGCYVAVATLKPGAAKEKGTWQGITSYTNFQFEEEGIRVWTAYGVGVGQFHSHNVVLKKTRQGSSGVVIGDYTIPDQITGSLSAHSSSQLVQVPCPEDGCGRMFPSQEALTMHMACGTHDALPLKDTKIDKVKRKWTEKVDALAKPSVSSGAIEVSGTVESGSSLVKIGWAQRGQRTARRNAPEVREFLEKEFMKGVNTGIKENPSNVATRLKATFSKEHWLTSQQVMSYFSRLSTKQKCGHLPGGPVVEESTEEEVAAVSAAVVRRRLRNKVAQEAGF
ncbi:uncharacterized protein LOC135500764 [Lineus longissimus]|uniref:uncharacterized protein LOC135500764 n=1 Tax=Lineus longissimus TaxID=88925 RepID=UPI00315D4425